MLVTPDSESLRATFDLANRLVGWGTFAVILGLGIDFVTLIAFSKGMGRTEKALLVLGNLFLIAGVGTEYFFGKESASVATQLQQLSDQSIARSDERIAELQAAQAKDQRVATQAAKHAADLGVTLGNLQTFVQARQATATRSMTAFAKAIADERRTTAVAVTRLSADRARLERTQSAAEASLRVANQDLADLNADLPQVQRDVTQAQAYLGEMNAALQEERAFDQRLLSMVTPRSLSSEQQAAIVKEVARFAPMRVDIFPFGETPEVADFAAQLGDVLARAGWKPSTFSLLNAVEIRGRGVVLFTRQGASAETVSAANALAEALVSVQISARVQGTFAAASNLGPMVGPAVSQEPADIRLFVGPRPEVP